MNAIKRFAMGFVVFSACALCGELAAAPAETISPPSIALPAGYQQLQSVSVQKGEYLNLDLVATAENDLGFEIVFKEPDLPGSNVSKSLVGTDAANGGSPWLYFSVTEFSGAYYSGINGTQTNTSKGVKLEAGYHQVLYNYGDDRAIVADGVKGAVLPGVPTSNDKNLLLFKRGDIAAIFEGELYSFRVFSRASGEDVSVLVPALFGDTSGLYDTVRNRFFACFHKGAALEDYRRLTKLQFTTGTSLDFGFVVRPEDDCQINFKFDANGYANNKFVLGTIGGGIVPNKAIHLWVHWSLYNNKYYYGDAGAEDLHSDTITYKDGPHEVGYNVGANRDVIIDGVASTKNLPNPPSSNTRKLLIGQRETSKSYNGFISELTVTNRNTQAELVHLVPVVGVDSGELGFYDLARQRFYVPTSGSLLSDEILPEDIVRLEYIDFPADGKACVDTGLKITADMNARIDFKFTSGEGASGYLNDEHIIGTGRSQTSEKYIHWTAYSNGNKVDTRAWYFGCNGSGDYNTLNKKPWSEGEHVVKYNVGAEHAVLVDGDNVYTLPGAPMTDNNPLLIGQRGSAVNFTGRIYYLKVYRQSSEGGNELLLNLIPASIKGTSGVGFYDKISGKFILSSGAGVVTGGPKWRPPSTLIFLR